MTMYGQCYSNLMWLTTLFSSYRRSSENTANNPLPPLPGDMEDHFDLESEEKTTDAEIKSLRWLFGE